MEKKKILLIEDNTALRENTAEILSLSNFEVIVAENGKEGVDLAQSQNPDLIICDIMMPVLDGYGVLHILSKNESTSSIPFIFLTAKVEKSDLRKGMLMGADDYLTKPFDELELLNAIETRLKKSEILKKELQKSIVSFEDSAEDSNVFSKLTAGEDEESIHSFPKKQIIYAEGRYPSGVYQIKKGIVKTFMGNNEGKELITGIHKSGEFIGFVTMLEGKAYEESAQALEDTELIFIPKDRFNSLIHNNREVSGKFINLLAENIQEREKQLIKLAYNSVRKRIADALTLLHDQYKKDSDDVNFCITREDLANMAGTATESAIRTLTDFKNEGLIDIIQRSEIRILDIEHLRNLKN